MTTQLKRTDKAPYNLQHTSMIFGKAMPAAGEAIAFSKLDTEKIENPDAG